MRVHGRWGLQTLRFSADVSGALRGKRPFIFEVPVLTPYLSSLWLHVVTPVKAGVARPLIEGLRTETIVQDDRIRELVPLALTPFDTAAQAAFRSPNSWLVPP